MSAITKYQNMLAELEVLKANIEKLEQSDQLKRELEFKAQLEKLMDQYSKDAHDVLKVLDMDSQNASIGPRRTRSVMVYKNPHTDEVVKTKGGNNRILNEWRMKYGREAVDSWKETA